jgi:RPA family protein
MSSEDDEVNRREVAYRLFAAEFDDADYSFAESDEERAPNYVVTPTGARVNRVFVVGVLTEVEPVNDDVVRARIVDPTGAFVVYAGQYQPEALAALEAAETPSFVAVTGKARTFEPDDADVIYTSIRPEHVSEVDADTRDRWAVTTAEQTVDRVETMAAARDRVERGDELRRVLEATDVPHGLASGIPLALDHYDTSPAYLDAVRDLALDAARVVAGDLDEVEGLSLAPSEGGDAALDFADTIDVDVEVGADDELTESGTDETATESTGSTDAESVDAEPTEAEVATDQTESEIVESADAPDVETDESTDEQAEAAVEGADATAEESDTSADAAEAEQSDGEMYELSEEEREEIEENYDVGFSSGSDIPEAGEADIDAPEPDEPATGVADDAQAEPENGEESDLGTEATDDDVDAADVGADADDGDDLGDFDDGEDLPDAEGDVEDVDTSEEFTEEEYDDVQSEMDDDEAGSMDVDLEDAVVDLMEELDDGDGAPRDEVITTATEEYDADEGDIEDAIQAALMGGRCYEAGDDHLKAI